MGIEIIELPESIQILSNEYESFERKIQLEIEELFFVPEEYLIQEQPNKSLKCRVKFKL